MQWHNIFWQVLPPGLQSLPAPPPPPFTPPPLALPLPKWLLEHQECKCSRQCHLPRYFRSSMDVFLWTFSCIKLHRAMLWLEVVDLMFPSVGFYLGFFLFGKRNSLHGALHAWAQSGKERLLYMAVEDRSVNQIPSYVHWLENKTQHHRMCPIPEKFAEHFHKSLGKEEAFNIQLWRHIRTHLFCTFD